MPLLVQFCTRCGVTFNLLASTDTPPSSAIFFLSSIAILSFKLLSILNTMFEQKSIAALLNVDIVSFYFGIFAVFYENIFFKIKRLIIHTQKFKHNVCFYLNVVFKYTHRSKKQNRPPAVTRGKHGDTFQTGVKKRLNSPYQVIDEFPIPASAKASRLDSASFFSSPARLLGSGVPRYPLKPDLISKIAYIKPLTAALVSDFNHKDREYEIRRIQQLEQRAERIRQHATTRQQLYGRCR